MPYMINCRDMSVIGKKTELTPIEQIETLYELRLIRDNCIALIELCNHMIDEGGKSPAIEYAFDTHVDVIRAYGERIGD